MEYTKLQLVEIRKPEWRMASCRARGAVISIMAHCADMENGGRLSGASAWTDAQWMAVAGVRRADVGHACDAGLCHWDGDVLVVPMYDAHGEGALATKRAQGPHGAKGAAHGAKGGRPPKTPIGGGEETPSGGYEKTPPVHTSPVHTSPVQSTPPAAPTPTTDEPDHDIGFSSSQNSPKKTEEPRTVKNIHAMESALNDGQILHKIREFGGKTQGDNAVKWPRIYRKFGHDAVVSALASLPAKDRWPDRTEEFIEENQQTTTELDPDPLSTLVDQAITRDGWQACRDRLDLPAAKVASEADLRAVLTSNRGAARELVGE